MFIICAKKAPTLRESFGYSLFAKHFGSEAFGEKLLESHLLIVTYRACDYNYHFVGVAEFTHHLSADAAGPGIPVGTYDGDGGKAPPIAIASIFLSPQAAACDIAVLSAQIPAG